MAGEKCVFLDRDGVLNVERGQYTFRVEDFELEQGVPEALQLLKKEGYLLVVITNQGGIGKGLYTRHDMEACHQKLQRQTSHLLDAIYYAPAHPAFSESLSRKPGSLLFEKAIARFGIDPARSWMVGDQPRDLEAAAKVGVRGILVNQPHLEYPRKQANLLEAARYIVGQKKTDQ